MSRRTGAATLMAFVHAEIPGGQPVPERLHHRLDVSLDEAGQRFSVTAGDTTVAGSPVVLGPPLVGRVYFAGDGCCDSTRHIRALLPIDGRYWLAQRFAIDWERVDEDGRLATGDLSNPASYHIYGQEVLAVAAGEVVTAVDGLPDQVPGKLPDGLPLSEADGNHVILQIDAAHYALYAHLKPGSVRVKAGDRVARGDVLGLVGNSGNSSEPHLHLHVMDRPSSLAANGLPYVFERFRARARDMAGTADFDTAAATGSALDLTWFEKPVVNERRLPMDLWLIDWPE